MPIRVFIADDHQFVIDHFITRFTGDPEFTYAGKAKDIEELRLHLKQKASLIDILVLDTFGTKKEFLLAVEALLEDYPDLLIIVLSSTEDLHFAKQLMDLGVRGYLGKIIGFEAVSSSIKEVYHTPETRILKLPESKAADSDREKVANLLTPRELQVISLLCKGFRNNEEIASFLSSINRQKIVNTTVQTHRKNIKKKLRDFEVLNDTSLGYWMAKWDLLDGSELSSTKE